MYSQRVAAPPMQVSTNHDLESQTSTCGKVCLNFNRAAGLIAAGTLTWLTASLAQKNEIGGAVTAGILDTVALGALLISEINHNTIVARALGAVIDKCPTCPKPSGGQLGATVAGLATAIGLPLVIAGAVNHHERMALAGGLSMMSGIAVGLMIWCSTIPGPSY